MLFYSRIMTLMFKLLFSVLNTLMQLNCTNGDPDPSIKEKSQNVTNNPPLLWTIDYTSNGKYYAVGGDDKLLRIFEATSLRVIKTYRFSKAIQCLDWNPDGKLLAIALDDQPVALLNFETGQLQKLETTGSRALAWNHTGDMLATGDYNGLLYLWSKL